MAALDLINSVIIIPDSTTSSSWSGEQVPTTISFYNEINGDLLQNLSTTEWTTAHGDALIEGFLYVPDIAPADPCFNITESYVPARATRKDDLPDINYQLVALAPWINANCTKAYIAAAQSDPVWAFVFYLPNNDITRPPSLESSVWGLNDGDSWINETGYQLFAVPGYTGAEMMTALSNYSGNVSSVPYGNILLDQYHLDPRDYVRVFTQIDLPSSSSQPSSGLSGLWVFLIILIGVVVLILATSLSMHWLQWRRRQALRRRIASGDVNLETLGIKRLTVPKNIIDKMPLLLYTCSAEDRAVENQAVSTNTKGNSSPTNEPGRRASLTAHDYLPHSQPTCPICLDDFSSGNTTIRQLPCLHVFHPECIDLFLSNHSSLCPMCKKSILPVGYCPTKVTNAMVTRERAVRPRGSNGTVPNNAQDSNGRRSTLQNWRAAVDRRLGRAQPEIRNPPPVYDGGVAMEMQPVIDMEGPRPREVYPHMSRADIAQIRARELLGGAEVEDNDGSAPKPRWRRVISRIFPGFR
ncbi:hypothetical protein L207DRAFT_506228 [Hyaloscypha variabilis F]|uniref:RING-type domain-containing protein n=1 Tax=Hyaloscypha variabilis (strain UAMH 11265 / GT02V1 / F) TaxID=1149755 RepID=A0A2J6S8X9_HYAVF|nr:hypothetical protein L207DRAFT_506228 [Hyaloscypha variabilis F]